MLLSSVSSDGFINVYDLTALLRVEGQEGEPEAGPVASYDTKGTRLTVCTMAEGRAARNMMHAMEGGEEEESEEDSEEEEADIYGSEVDSEQEDGVEVEIESDEEEEEEEESEEEAEYE